MSTVPQSLLPHYAMPLNLVKERGGRDTYLEDRDTLMGDVIEAKQQS